MPEVCIDLPEPMLAEIERRMNEGHAGEQSLIIQRIIDRYLELVRRSRPDLGERQWKLVLESLVEVPHEPATMVSVLPHSVADGMRRERLDEKWGVDGEALVARLAQLSYAAQVAVIDDAECYAAAVARDELETESAT